MHSSFPSGLWVTPFPFTTLAIALRRGAERTMAPGLYWGAKHLGVLKGSTVSCSERHQVVVAFLASSSANENPLLTLSIFKPC